MSPEWMKAIVLVTLIVLTITFSFLPLKMISLAKKQGMCISKVCVLVISNRNLNGITENSKQTRMFKYIRNRTEADPGGFPVGRRGGGIPVGVLTSDAGAFWWKRMRKRKNWVPFGEGAIPMPNSGIVSIQSKDVRLIMNVIIIDS